MKNITLRDVFKNNEQRREQNPHTKSSHPTPKLMLIVSRSEDSRRRKSARLMAKSFEVILRREGLWTVGVVVKQRALARCA